MAINQCSYVSLINMHTDINFCHFYGIVRSFIEIVLCAFTLTSVHYCIFVRDQIGMGSVGAMQSKLGGVGSVEGIW